MVCSKKTALNFASTSRLLRHSANVYSFHPGLASAGVYACMRRLPSSGYPTSPKGSTYAGVCYTHQPRAYARHAPFYILHFTFYTPAGDAHTTTFSANSVACPHTETFPRQQLLVLSSKFLTLLHTHTHTQHSASYVSRKAANLVNISQKLYTSAACFFYMPADFFLHRPRAHARTVGVRSL